MKRFLVWIFFWVGKITLWPIQWLYFRKRVYYEDKKTTSRRIKGGALIVSNHKGLMDFPMSMFIFPFHKLYCLMSELIYNHGKLLDHLKNINLKDSSEVQKQKASKEKYREGKGA